MVSVTRDVMNDPRSSHSQLPSTALSYILVERYVKQPSSVPSRMRSERSSRQANEAVIVNQYFPIIIEYIE